MSESLDLQLESPPLSSPVCGDCATNQQGNCHDVSPATARTAGDLGRRRGKEEETPDSGRHFFVMRSQVMPISVQSVGKAVRSVFVIGDS